MCRAFYALMKARGSGVIVNVVGNAADTHDPDYICGVAGNASLTAFTQSLGCVSARDGIRVIALSPGPVETDRLVTLMKVRKAGVIVNVVGNAADTHDPEYICGVAGNAALTAFTQSLGCVSAKDGIRVVALSPGPVETDRLVGLMKKKAKDRTGSEDNWKDLLKPLPFSRGATPEEIGAAIAFLVSGHSGYTSGSVVTIDAGVSARAGAF